MPPLPADQRGERGRKKTSKQKGGREKNENTLIPQGGGGSRSPPPFRCLSQVGGGEERKGGGNHWATRPVSIPPAERKKEGRTSRTSRDPSSLGEIAPHSFLRGGKKFPVTEGRRVEQHAGKKGRRTPGERIEILPEKGGGPFSVVLCGKKKEGRSSM